MKIRKQLGSPSVRGIIAEARELASAAKSRESVRNPWGSKPSTSTIDKLNPARK